MKGDAFYFIIIGCGIAGLATAIRLRQQGIKVLIIEKNDYPGGKIHQIQNQNFRFDAGPSLLTQPYLIDELYKLCGKNPSNYFSYSKPTLNTKYFYPDETIINAYNNKTRFINELARKNREQKKSLEDFLSRQAINFKRLSPVFLEQSLHIPSNYFSAKILKALLRLPKLHPFSTMSQSLQKQFSHPRTRILFERYATYNGSSPYKAPAIFNVIAHLENNEGAFVAKGGMYRVVSSLLQLAKDMGVEFRFNTTVDEIILQNGRATGVKTGEKEIKADGVISNADINFTYSKLLKNVPPPAKYLDNEKSTSAIIFYWGMKKEFPALDIHNIFFSSNYQKEFEYLFHKKEIFDDPTIYIYISKKFNPYDAPENCENWFVMINTPPDEGQDWQKEAEHIREICINKIEKTLKTDGLRNLIVTENIKTPNDLEKDTGAFKGSLYGNSSNSRFAAFLRHPNFSSIKGLYFTGGTVHPGGGIPLCLRSAEITAKKIREDYD